MSTLMIFVWYAAVMRDLRFLSPALLALALAAGCDSGGHQDAGLPPRQEACPAPDAVEAATPASLFEFVTARARGLANASYSGLEAAVPPALVNLSYDQYRSIRFRPDAALWQDDSQFEVQLFHPGYLYDERVRIFLVNDTITELEFDASLFSYDGAAAPVATIVTPDVGYAGFRIHYPLNDATIKDEVAVFLGASYFRLLGRGHLYGLSSRGLAVDIGMNKAEEFPDFREFWLVRPDRDATTLTMYALLDSPSVTGAYRLDLAPGRQTTLEVEARVFARMDVDKLGVAPMSSMFMFDENRRPAFDDFRAQVHDSDGAMVQTADNEWLWRPLNNGPGTQVTQLSEGTPRGFGLLQRDRSFDNYLDLEASYQRRPSEWVVVEDGDWGRGRVELLTFETSTEFSDNIAAYWVPSRPFRAGDARQYRYRLVMFDDRPDGHALGRVLRTRIGQDTLPDVTDVAPRTGRLFVVDFERDEMVSVDDTRSPVAVIDASSGTTFLLPVQTLPDGQGWRAAFRLAPSGERPADLRLHLEQDGRRLSETWNYVWYPQ